MEITYFSPPPREWSHEEELELAALVQLGVQAGVVEDHNIYLIPPSRNPGGETRGCLLGTAIVGKFGDPELAYDTYHTECITNRDERYGAYIGSFSKLFNISGALLRRASNKHMM